MPSQTVELSATIEADPESIYDFLIDHESFGRIWPSTMTRIRDSDEPGNPNGVGSVRLVKQGLLQFEETHITCERPRLIQYRVTRGGPIKNHLGSIRLIPDASGTRIHYTIEFDPKIPCTGCLIACLLKRDWARGIAPVARELASAKS